MEVVLISVTHRKAHLSNHVKWQAALCHLGSVIHWEGENIMEFKIAWTTLFLVDTTTIIVFTMCLEPSKSIQSV